MEDLREQISAKVRELRKALKLTQSNFAEKVGLSEEHIRNIERCKSTPSLEAVFKIAKGLNLSVNELLDFDDYPSADKNEALASIITLLQTRSQEDIKLLHEVGVKIFNGLDRQKK